jgi:hypothetical protein
MKLNLKKSFESILRWGKAPDKKDDLPVSMVLLLREPRFLTLDQLRSAAERAFGTSFAEAKQSRHFVVQAAFLTIIKAGPHSLSFLNYTKPYGDDSPEFWKAMPTASQRQAWAEHSAWTAVDYVKGGMLFSRNSAPKSSMPIARGCTYRENECSFPTTALWRRNYIALRQCVPSA